MLGIVIIVLNLVINHNNLYFNYAPVASAPFLKHIGLFLDENLTFGHHLNEKIYKANKSIGLIKRLYFYLLLWHYMSQTPLYVAKKATICRKRHYMSQHATLYVANATICRKV